MSNFAILQNISLELRRQIFEALQATPGAQTARVVGTLDGKRIAATFSRSDGCQIGRWNRVSPWLLPRGGVI